MSLRSASQPNLPRHDYDIPLRRRIRWPRLGRTVAPAPSVVPASEPATTPAATVAAPKGACC